MSQQPAPMPVPDRQPLDENAAASVRVYAADQRAAETHRLDRAIVAISVNPELETKRAAVGCCSVAGCGCPDARRALTLRAQPPDGT
ncbi:hypothetical protein ACWCPX_46290 [Streptomyces olivaceoviridis]